MSPSDQPRGKPPAPMPAEPAVRQRALAGLLVALLSLTGVMAFGDPQRGIVLVGYALLAGVVAMWLAVTAQVRARRGRTMRPFGSVAAAAIAGVGILLSVILLLGFIVLGQQMSAYGRCLNQAGTDAARQACQVQFTRAVNKEIASLQSAGQG